MALDTAKCQALLELIERLKNTSSRGSISTELADAGIDKANKELEAEFKKKDR